VSHSKIIRPIVPAAGYGYIHKGKSKLVEPLFNMPMIRQVVSLLQITELANPIVVINRRYGNQIKTALANIDCQFVEQPTRNGTAGAILCALPYVKEKSILVIYPDMPAWTARTIKKLIHLHQSSGAVISLASVQLDSQYLSTFRHYGRIFKDDGRITKILEPQEIQKSALPHLNLANPSLFCFNTHWLSQTIFKIKPVSKGDGYPAEFQLSKTVEIASSQGCKISEMPLSDKSEALGVNTLGDYIQILGVLEKRQQA